MDVRRAIGEIATDIESKTRDSSQASPHISTENDKSTVDRLERLLLLVCAFPNGLKNTVKLHGQLLCNAATAKRLIQSGIETELVTLTENTLY
ncbi:hypothetical protein, partial [Pseudomonas viridiflava]|uniref:hypothetical protein n=1 Tax=Pseudomonas viridiflava TaxID=33069 RepID=UPI001ADCF0D6